MQATGISPGETGATRRPGGTLFNWVHALLSTWLAGGAYLDGWAHVHEPHLETFFTPWHAVLYSGFLAVAAFTVGALLLGRGRGYRWSAALPPGYGLSLLGVAIFGTGAMGDMIWHVLFGIEVDVEALLSPTHLALALGAGLILTGPVRAIWPGEPLAGLARQAAGWRAQGPALIALALVLSMFSFFTQYAHPWANPVASARYHPVSGEDIVFFRLALGIASILLQAAVFAGVMLFSLGRTKLPFGAFGLVLGLNAVLMALMRDQHWVIPVAIAGGLAADGLVVLVRPGESARRLRLFAFLAPAVLFGCYFLGLALTLGIGWSVHMWSGAIVLAGAAGWLVSYVHREPSQR